VTQRRLRLGASGEDRAAAWYEGNGYEVLDRNWRCREGELDLVCHRDGVIVFSEVKTRSSLVYGHPAEAVTPAKQRKVRQVATRWLGAHRDREYARGLRFDVVAVLPGEVSVIEAAF
jgi:putative endonuclease